MSSEEDIGRAIVGAVVTGAALFLLHKLADQRGVSVSDVVRQALTEHVPELGTVEDISPKGRAGRPKGVIETKPRAPKRPRAQAPDTVAS